MGLDVGPLDDFIAVGESLGLSEEEASAIYDTVREDLLADIIDNADVYHRPPGYAARPRSGPVEDEATGSEAR